MDPLPVEMYIFTTVIIYKLVTYVGMRENSNKKTSSDRLQKVGNNKTYDKCNDTCTQNIDLQNQSYKQYVAHG